MGRGFRKAGGGGAKEMQELSDTEPESGDSDEEEEFFVPPGSPQPLAGEAASKTDRVTRGRHDK